MNTSRTARSAAARNNRNISRKINEASMESQLQLQSLEVEAANFKAQLNSALLAADQVFRTRVGGEPERVPARKHMH